MPTAPPTALRFAVLGSGSSGNATLVESGRARVLVDAGLSAREIERRLEALGLGLADLDAVLVSHEHQDHARGLENLVKGRKLPILGSRGTLRALRTRLEGDLELQELPHAREFRIADLAIEAFAIPHDAAEPVGFRLSAGDARLGHLTDIGRVPESVVERLGGLGALFVESNHDLEMLRSGPYPQRLKKRILSPFGHLSNDATGDLLRRTNLASLRLLVLAHLSLVNNRPELARTAAALAVEEKGVQADIHIAPADGPTPWFEVPVSADAHTHMALASARARPRLPLAVQLELSFAWDRRIV